MVRRKDFMNRRGETNAVKFFISSTYSVSCKCLKFNIHTRELYMEILQT
jgi:hypothetical protein